MFSYFTASRRKAAISPGFIPLLLPSPPILTSASTFIILLFFFASLSITASSRTLSTDWIRSNSFTASFALLLCKCPIICFTGEEASRGNFSLASWTRFSPIVPNPAATAASTSTGDLVFVTAIKRMSSGLRPEDLEASAIRFLIMSMFSAMLTFFWTIT